MDKVHIRKTVDELKTEVFQIDPRLTELKSEQRIRLSWSKQVETYFVGLSNGPTTSDGMEVVLTEYYDGKWHDTDSYPGEGEE